MNKSIGLVEIQNVSKGVVVLDDMLKSAHVTLLQAQPICPGKYIIIIGGLLSDINASVEKAKTIAQGFVIDSFILGNVDEQVFPAITGSTDIKEHQALGIIETFTVASAIEAGDTAAKTSQVQLIEIRTARGMGGKSFVAMTGNIADVTAAVEAGARRAKEEGMLVNTETIANPHPDVWSNIL